MADAKGQTENESKAHVQAPKLTNWKKEPTIGQLQDDLEASRPAHDAQVLKVKDWNDLMKVAGRHKPAKVKGRSQVQPKLVRRQAEWRYSALTEPFNSANRLFDVKPKTFEDVASSKQNKTVLHWQFSTKINKVNFIDHYVRTSVDEGAVIVRVGWCRVTKEVEEEVPVYTYRTPMDESEVQFFDAAVQLLQMDPRQFNETVPEEWKAAVKYSMEEYQNQAVVAEVTGSQKVKVEKVIDNRPTIEIINQDNFYCDPTCGMDLDKAGFVIVSFETSQAELKKKPQTYKNLNHVNWEGATALLEPNHTPNSKDVNFNFKDPLRKKVVAYEYWGNWDIHGTGELIPIVATWVGNTLVRLEENPFPDGKPPFIVANYMPIKRELLGEPDAELLGDNQAIQGALTRGMIDLMARSANSQQGFAKGMLDVVNRRRYDQGQDYEFNPNVSPAMGLIEHKYPEIPQSAMVMLNLQNQEAEALTGVKSFSGGISGEAYGDVAAGIRGALDAASKREMAILRRLAAGIVQIGKKIISMNAVFLSEEETVRVTNTEFVTIKREELAGEFDLEVDISTAEIDNNKAQDLAFMLQTIGPNGDIGMTLMILADIAELKRMPDLAQKIRTFQPKPDPIAEQIKMMELRKLTAEVAKLEAEAGLTQAKTEKTMVEADAIDLEVTEQETGTNHARAIELAGAQASANQNLEVTKALTRPVKTKDGGEKAPDIEAAAGWNELTRHIQDPRSKNNAPITTINERNSVVAADPRLSLGSKQFDPKLDPALNPAINI